MNASTQRGATHESVVGVFAKAVRVLDNPKTRRAIPVLLVPVWLLSTGGGTAQPGRSPQAVAHSPGEPEALAHDAGVTTPNSVRFLALGAQTNGAWSLIELTEMPGTKTTWHRHPRSDQAYYVREGVFTVKVGEKVYELPPGGYIFIPRGVPHGHANFGMVPVKVLLTNAPAGFEDYFQARVGLLKVMTRANPEFQKRMSDLRHRYDVEELGDWDIRR
jgi:quercetin dioxygenase-like cupin family protein